MRSLSKGIVHDAIRCWVLPARRNVRHLTAGPARVPLIVAALLALVLATASERAWASPSVRATSSAADLTAADAFTLQTPVGALPGDVLVSGLDLRLPGTVEVTPPVGWILIRRDGRSNGSFSQLLYYKVVGPFEPSFSTWTWNWSSSVAASGGIVAAAGVDGGSSTRHGERPIQQLGAHLRSPFVDHGQCGRAPSRLFRVKWREWSDSAERDGRGHRCGHGQRWRRD